MLINQNIFSISPNNIFYEEKKVIFVREIKTDHASKIVNFIIDH